MPLYVTTRRFDPSSMATVTRNFWLSLGDFPTITTR